MKHMSRTVRGVLGSYERGKIDGPTQEHFSGFAVQIHALKAPAG
jgi:hypothetical protein